MTDPASCCDLRVWDLWRGDRGVGGGSGALVSLSAVKRIDVITIDRFLCGGDQGETRGGGICLLWEGPSLAVGGLRQRWGRNGLVWCGDDAGNDLWGVCIRSSEVVVDLPVMEGSWWC